MQKQTKKMNSAAIKNLVYAGAIEYQLQETKIRDIHERLLKKGKNRQVFDPRDTKGI